ncbi:MAG: PD40 domain-containing protein, partial [Bacteroidetes bacterium]|nr:PD40 domain-containing protein [Bacteroidota bacterium]
MTNPSAVILSSSTTLRTGFVEVSRATATKLKFKQIIKLFTIFLFIIIVNSSFAQLKRANKHYDNFEYIKAIQLYEKVVKKNPSAEALEKLANSYRLTKNYSQAELIYAKLMSQPNITPINHFYYGMVLKNNNKIDAAKEQFKLYSNAVPTDKKAELSVKSCDDIKLWISKAQQFEVKTVANINSKHSDFCPMIYKNQLVFVSERTKDLVNSQNFSWNKQPFLNVYFSTIKKGPDGSTLFSKKAKPFSWHINTNFHDGPVCFNAEQTTMYLTRVNYVVNKKDDNFVNRPGLYTAVLEGKKWGKTKPFQYNSNEYSIAHSSISADGQWLFFASDIPGGQGAMDIYVCKKENNGWGQPKNLGSAVNTPGTEVFPYIRKDGILYFSSDAHSGFGGLDIFSATNIENNFTNVKNLGFPLNSSTDDFGIVFSDDNTNGYFSSDRSGGQGSDDIYAFTALNKFLTVSGKILLSQNVKDPAKNAKVTLLTEDGSIVNISTTDSTGFFKFENLDPDKKYLVKLDETDPMFVNKKKFYMTDDKDKIVRVTV